MSERAPAVQPETRPHRTVATGLAKLALVLRNESWAQGSRAGLTPTQAQLLVALRARDGARATELAAEVGISQPTASDSIAALASKGLVDKRRGADGRALSVRLTARGRREADRAATWPDVLAEAADSLEPDEQAALLRGLTAMIASLQERGRIPVARMCATCRYFRPNAHTGADRPHHCAFVDAPFGDRELRLDCADFQPNETKETA